MKEETKEWSEIILWFAVPIIFFGAIAVYEYVARNFIVSALFAIVFVLTIVRRAIVTRKEIEPIVDAESQMKKPESTEPPKEA